MTEIILVGILWSVAMAAERLREAARAEAADYQVSREWVSRWHRTQRSSWRS